MHLLVKPMRIEVGAKTLLKHISYSRKHTVELDLNDKGSLMGNIDESEGLWNSKCAIDRSMGFVSVSMFANPVYLNTARC